MYGTHLRSSHLTHERFAHSRDWIIWVGDYGAMRPGPAGFMLQDTCSEMVLQEYVGELIRHYMQHRLVLGIGEMRLGCIHALRC
jgi:hypothetical protein